MTHIHSEYLSFPKHSRHHLEISFTCIWVLFLFFYFSGTSFFFLLLELDIVDVAVRFVLHESSHIKMFMLEIQFIYLFIFFLQVFRGTITDAPDFDPSTDAETLYNAMKGIGKCLTPSRFLAREAQSSSFIFSTRRLNGYTKNFTQQS